MTTGAHPIRSRSRRLLSVWLGFWLVMFVATHIPVTPRQPLPVPSGDKIFHFVGYFVLAWLGGMYLRAVRPSLPAGRLIVWGLIYAGYAFLDEWLQRFTGRTMSLTDWLADVGGVATATTILIWRVRVSDRASARG